MMLRWIPWGAFLVVLLGSAAAWATARPGEGSGGVRLRTRVEVSSGVVRLRDLLASAVRPGHAPAAAATDRVVALAPEPGSPQMWRRNQVRQRLLNAGLDATEFVIPAEIVITRQASPIAEPFVIEALTAHFGHPVEAADVDYTAPLTSVPDHPGVVVLGASFDARRGGLDVRCQAKNDPSLLPFLVFLRLPAADLAQRRLSPISAVAQRQALPELVHPGQPAGMDIRGAAFALHAEVMPLQAGRVGDHIRAVSLATHAVLQVEVVGPDQVRLLTAESRTTRGLQGYADTSAMEAWHAPQ